MAKVNLKERSVEADVLCIGGGIAGMMAAIRAAELGAKTIIAEKANTMFSGAGATGNDHFLERYPAVLERAAKLPLVAVEVRRIDEVGVLLRKHIVLGEPFCRQHVSTWILHGDG